MLEKTQVIETLGDVLSFMAPSLGGAVPESTSEEYIDWVRSIQVKQEEASRRGFWRRLLTKDTLSLREGDVDAYLPVRFQRANGLYILYVDGVDLADPDREADSQGIFCEVDNDPESEAFGEWMITFSTPIATDQEAPIWYFATPPTPSDSTDKVLLPGDMLAYGAMAEVFRHTNLEGSQDSATIEYENRLSTYLAMEEIPERYRLLNFSSNPRAVNRSVLARNQYIAGRGRIGRSF